MKTNGQDANNKLATQEKKSLKQWVVSMTEQVKCALPQNITPERMTRIALTAISKDSKLASSTPESFLGALLTSAQLGLECNTPLGQAYLIPFFNGKTKKMETQFQLGYQGLLDLCYRTNQYKTIQARVVYDGDFFEYSYGLDEKLVHKPSGDNKNPIFVYAYYQLTNGAKAFEVMSWDAILNHAKKYSQSSNSSYSPWQTDPESMAKKTVLKKVLKYAPKAVESATIVAEAISSDSAVIKTSIIKDGNDTIISKDLDYNAPINITLSGSDEDNIDTEFEKQESLEQGDL